MSKFKIREIQFDVREGYDKNSRIEVSLAQYTALLNVIAEAQKKVAAILDDATVIESVKDDESGEYVEKSTVLDVADYHRWGAVGFMVQPLSTDPF